jgi:hypothetical protein
VFWHILNALVDYSEPLTVGKKGDVHKIIKFDSSDDDLVHCAGGIDAGLPWHTSTLVYSLLNRNL